jgi:hypothetical protein
MTKQPDTQTKRERLTKLGGEDTDGFLRRLIQGLFPSRGAFVEDDEERSDTGTSLLAKTDLPLFDQPQRTAEEGSSTIRRQPVIFMRQRRTGPGNVFDAN